MEPIGSRLTPTRITDPKAVAAITHPLRMRLLGELSRRGTARAVDLAAETGEPANSVSFHLRQLARFGLIEENPERAHDARERWWRQTSDRGFQIDLEAMKHREGGDAAVKTLRQVAEGHVLALHRAIHRSPNGVDPAPAAGDGHEDSKRCISDDFALRLSAAELEQLRTELGEFLDRWAEISHANAAKDGGQERQAYYGVVMAALETDITAAYDNQGATDED